MKKTALLVFAMSAILTSCGKVEEDIVDCVGQSAFFDINHTVSAGNPLQVTFSLHYSGSGHTLNNSVKWDFGDGTPIQTLSGTTATHTYSSTGHYTAKAKATLNTGCSSDLHEPISLE